ncbi:hypothetical protein AVEN_206395-1 [Araneus ventricosus]|uniref:DUF4817 domain-containing protein n=1 Tax=Araneus ventricosus TaxID=182803 RepID=A0A4Y2EJZ9_ARAVE|nr:hypothetical protein AVEN_206395-1 [Araneus ventricosus]
MMDEKYFRAFAQTVFLKRENGSRTKLRFHKHNDDCTPFIGTVIKLFFNFRNDYMRTCKTEYPVRPVKASTQEINEKIQDLVTDDRNVKVREIAKS